MNTKRANFIIVALVVLSSLGTVFALFFGEKFSTYDSYRNDVYSFSAVGHRAFREVLELNFESVEILQDVSQRFDYLLIIEPDLEGQKDEFQELVGPCITCILVLPKRIGIADDDRHHIAKFKLIKSVKVDAMLDQYFVNLTNLKLDRALNVTADINRHDLPSPQIAGPVQVVKGVPVENIIYGSQNGALIFSEAIDNVTRIVISDPDILANHGIDEAQNYKFILGYLQSELGPEYGKIGIDETMHGYRRAPSLLRLLTSFPLSIFTIQLLLILLFATWRGLIVFGRPNRNPRATELGAKILIDNTASLFSPNHAVYLGRRYALAAVNDVAQSLNAPRQLPKKELIIWLDEQTERRGFSFRISEVLSRFEDFEIGLEQWKPKEIVTMAQQVDQWRNRMRKE